MEISRWRQPPGLLQPNVGALKGPQDCDLAISIGRWSVAPAGAENRLLRRSRWLTPPANFLQRLRREEWRFRDLLTLPVPYRTAGRAAYSLTSGA